MSFRLHYWTSYYNDYHYVIFLNFIETNKKSKSFALSR